MKIALEIKKSLGYSICFAFVLGFLLFCTSSDQTAKPTGMARCQFVIDQKVKQIPHFPRPGYLERFTDPVFGMRVVRVTAPEQPIPNLGVTWGPVARQHYSLDQAWNADQTLLILGRGTSGHGQLYLHGRTYEPLFFQQEPLSGTQHRWDPVHPHLRIFVGGHQAGKWDVTTGKITQVYTFQGYTKLQFGPNKGNPSNDGKMVAVQAQDRHGNPVAFAIDVQAGKKTPDIPLPSGLQWSYVTISPVGDLIVAKTEKSDQTQVYNLEGNLLQHWTEYGRPSHFDLTVDEQGEQVTVGVSKSAPDKGYVIKRRLRDGVVTKLLSGWASHTSARNIREPGWVYISVQDTNTSASKPFHKEVVAVALDGSGAVRRLAHTHYVRNNMRGDYVSETHASVSPDGNRIIFNSGWDDPSGTIAAYIIEVCQASLP
jgi:hypothetical protein